MKKKIPSVFIWKKVFQNNETLTFWDDGKDRLQKLMMIIDQIYKRADIIPITTYTSNIGLYDPIM